MKQQSTTTPDTSSTVPTPKRSKARQIFKWSTISLLVLCLFIVIALITLLNNQNAQQKLLTFVDQQLNDLTIGQISGNLQQGLQLDNVSYRTTGVDVKVAHLLLQLDTNCLWQAKICINQLNITEPKIAIDTSQFSANQQQDDRSSGLVMPVNIDLKQLNINQLDLQLDNQQILLDHFSTGLLATRDLQFNLLPTLINGLQVIETIHTPNQLPLTTKAKVKPQSKASPTDWDSLKQQLQQPLLHANSAFKLPLTVHIDDLTAKNWLYQKRSAKGKILSEIKMPTLTLQASADQNSITLNKLTLVSSVLDLSAQGELQQADHYPLQLTLNGKLHQQRENTQQKSATITLPESQFSLQVQGNLYQQLTTDITITGLADAKLTAQVALAEPKLPLMINLAIQQAKYPLYLAKEANPSTDQIRLVKTNLAITGNVLDYQASLQGNLSGMITPTVDLNLKGNGSIDSFTLQQATLANVNGNIGLQGTVSWRNGIAWDSQLDLQHVNMSRYFHFVDWLATLSGQLVSSGQINAEGWQVNIPLIELNGHADNKPISLKGDITLNNETLLMSQLFDFHYGDNHLAFYGKLGKESLFNLTIDAPNLAGFYKGLEASGKGTAQITGDIQHPEIDVDLTVPHLKVANVLLQKLNVKSKIQSDQQNIRGNLDLDIAQFKYGENVQLKQISLKAKGDEKQHTLSLYSQGKPVAFNTDLQGHFDRPTQVWQGEFNNTQFNTLIGKFNTNKVINVNYKHNEQQATISSHCWQHDSLPLCFPQQFTTGINGHIPFKLEKANLDFLKHILTDNTKLHSQFNLAGEVNWYQDKPFDFTVNLESSSFSLIQKIDYRQFKLELDKLSLESHIKDNNLTTKGDIKIHNNGILKTHLTLNDLLGTPTLSGTLVAEHLKLAFIKQLLNPGDNIDGNLNTNLTFSGNVSAPQLHGKVSLTHLTSSMPALPFNITDGFANLVFNGNHSTLNGEIVTKEGRLQLKGNSNWQVLNRWSANLSATSEKFSLTIPDLAKLTIVPNIHLYAQPNHFNIEGKIDVPFANIEIEQLPESALGVSADEVILEKKPKLSTQQKLDKFSEKTGTVLSTDIMITLGQRVRVSAYGLKSQLEGNLNVRQQDNQLGLFGQIHLLNGRYASFGQDLLIRKGEIIFSGLPSQPTLNIEAIRNPNAMETNTVTAGIRVSGLAESPTIQVFSEPSMSQDNALSYLLTGRALSSENSGSGASLGAALISLSLSKTGKAVGQLGETFGIKSLNLETQGLGDQSQVVVSGYITPRLQVKYGVGLFEPLAELTLRYRLLPKLYLQSVSGTSQAVDLLYQFEH
ncbi:translocation/assembly module TamB domain-containing protein [Gallibacterium trehalosifermentans]|uniref:Translocation/assembly module TamB domain-containing protein n=1 Tax=Gallibacterium trehalosifermentans TaxID=516935 RepID=A0ABV6H1T6_9PAST